MVPKAFWTGMENIKFLPANAFKPRTFQPRASHFYFGREVTLQSLKYSQIILTFVYEKDKTEKGIRVESESKRKKAKERNREREE